MECREAVRAAPGSLPEFQLSICAGGGDKSIEVTVCISQDASISACVHLTVRCIN